MQADNKYIGKMSAEVTIRIFTRPLTVSDSPNCSAVEPTLRQYAGTLSVSGESAVDNEVNNSNSINCSGKGTKS
jgi:hypothetical protein